MSGSTLLNGFLEVLSGLPATLLITVVSVAVSLPAGILIALIRIKKIPVLKGFFHVYVSFIRGTPLLVQIYVLYFSIPPILNSLFAAVGVSVRLSGDHPLLYALLIFSINTTAYLSETMRSALTSINKDQLEAAQSVGLSSFQAYTRIIIPQALVIALPSIGNVVLSVVKGSSLIFVIGVEEITAKGRLSAASTLDYTTAYGNVFLVYLLLCLSLDYLFTFFEENLKKYKSDQRAV